MNVRVNEDDDDDPDTRTLWKQEHDDKQTTTSKQQQDTTNSKQIRFDGSSDRARGIIVRGTTPIEVTCIDGGLCSNSFCCILPEACLTASEKHFCGRQICDSHKRA